MGFLRLSSLPEPLGGKPTTVILIRRIWLVKRPASPPGEFAMSKILPDFELPLAQLFVRVEGPSQ